MEKKKVIAKVQQQGGPSKAKAVAEKVAVMTDAKTIKTEKADKKASSAPAMPVTIDEKVKFLKGLRIRPANSRRDIYAEIKELRMSKADFNVMVQIVLGCAEITAEHAEWLTLAVAKEELRRVIAARL